ncbi:hypothetical protein HanRHA438_Chr07g0293331 [Helianthus annuus]|nr:hypothetical protein HanRHA438_Chr07g0293331 [Helianthus annuus]
MDGMTKSENISFDNLYSKVILLSQGLDVCVNSPYKCGISKACITTKHNFDLNQVLLQYFVFVHFTYGLVDAFH